MSAEMDQLFANFAALPEAKRKSFDEALTFMETARLPTDQGAKNRAYLREHAVSPAHVRMLGAYRAYKFGIKPQALDPVQAKAMRLKGVPEEEIARLGSGEKWEADQFGQFDGLMNMVKPREMPAEEITAKAKAVQAKRKNTAPTKEAPPPAAAAQPEGAPAAAPPPAPAPSQPDAAVAPLPAPVAAPMAMPPQPMQVAPMVEPQPVMTAGGVPVAPAPAMPMDDEQRRLMLAQGGM